MSQLTHTDAFTEHEFVRVEEAFPRSDAETMSELISRRWTRPATLAGQRQIRYTD